MNHGRRSRPGQSERGGFFVGLLVTMAVVAALVVLAWMLLLPRAVRGAVEEATGLPTTIGRLSANPFTGQFRAESIELGQPAGWPEGMLAEVSLCQGQVDLFSLRKPVLEVATLDLVIDRLVILVDERGRTNVEDIAVWTGAESAVWLAGSPRGVALASAGVAVSGQRPSEAVVVELNLTVGRLEIVDLGVTPARTVGDDLNFQHTYRDVREVRQIFGPKLMARLAQSPLVLNLLLQNGLLPGAEGASGGLRQLWERAGGAVNSFLQGLEQTGKP